MNTTAKKNHRIDTYLPLFAGFYNSGLDPIDDWDNHTASHELFEYPEKLKEEHLDYILELLYDHIDYTKLHLDISKECVELINKELKDNLPEGARAFFKFQKLISPKFYNYDTDSVNTAFYFNDIAWDYIKAEIRKFKNLAKFNTFIKDRYESHDGFISFYSSSSSDWLDDMDNITTAEKNEHKIGAIMEFYLEEVLGVTENDIISSINENIYVTGLYVDYPEITRKFNEKFNTNLDDIHDLVQD